MNDGPSCQCLSAYIGSPPNCRPECTINSDCPSNRACIRQKCVDPCPGSCGVGTQCSITNHIPMCTCVQGYTGDPFSNCYPTPPQRKTSFSFFCLKIQIIYRIIASKQFLQWHPPSQTPATRHPVDRTLSVTREYALVCRSIEAILTPVVVQNASSTTTAL